MVTKRGVCPIEDYGYEAIEKVIDMIAGKWKLRILYLLTKYECLRYGELKKHVPGITHKMLSMQLKELEKDKLLVRKEYPQVPPKVEYSLTVKGWGLVPLYEQLGIWVMENREEFMGL
ncbi:helix-turn-helix transcriptional regulator [Vagococcus sp. BWB3-3]|uniref:Helix-turn-helix transcriptional regulator n=1 Tax=Vagococcus allomyrinae TaxID=2794353 RepID=A0A940PCP1_9ENTE|nr:helix-turn-helix domain-containing protein [Vagococcus allomyrinae]MBP1042519.1 helix-turn-helix transcriptional regulator [Vagococcus allomyrinae]